MSAVKASLVSTRPGSSSASWLGGDAPGDHAVVEIPSPAPRLIALAPALQLAVVGLYGVTIGLVAWLDPVGDGIDALLIPMVLESPLILGAACTLGWWVGRARGPTRPDGSEYMFTTSGNMVAGRALALSLLLWAALIVFSYELRDL